MTFASLYDQKVIEKQFANIEITTKQRKLANEWVSKIKNKELEKEVENYDVFRDTVLIDLLGYPRNEIKFEVKDVEFSVTDVKGITHVVFEAKGTKTKDLFARQNYGKKEQEHPVLQTVSNMQRFAPPAAYGVCTNYNDFVLLDRDLGITKCHRFTFTDIENNTAKLKEFLGIFSYNNLVKEKSLEILYEKSLTVEKEFTQEFYKLYHETRLMLIREFQENKKDGVTKNEAVYYTQIFLNRLIFIFFVEDKEYVSDRQLFAKRIFGKLKSDQIIDISKQVYDTISELFVAFDIGSKELGVNGFNGELFSGVIPQKIFFSDLKEKSFFEEDRQHSKLLKTTKLNEEAQRIINSHPKLSPIITNLLIMESFDFNTDIDVNILGHIFEQSISDLEVIKGNVDSRRKKEGVFYTPEYITDYICRNTIIPYLSKSNVSTVHELIQEYSDNIAELENKFKEIKILDPACGSGAFLNKAVEVLLEIHKEIQYVKESRGKYSTGSQFQLTKWNEASEIRDIIENNIYGVDINQESVEITKLSLFLKLASNNRKLIGLSKNIQIGNSLVDDKSVDILAMNWKEKFPNIFYDPKLKKNESEFKLSHKMEDGFSVVIGNPPYIRIQRIDHKIIDYLLEQYSSAFKKFDISLMFFEKSLQLIKENGVIGFISSSQWINTDYGEKLREILSKGLIKEMVNFGSLPVFEDAKAYPAIFILGRKINEKLRYKKIDDTTKLSFSGILATRFTSLPYSEFDKKSWSFDEFNLISHLDKNKISWQALTDFGHFHIGALTGMDEVFVVSKDKILENNLESIFLYPYAYQGKEVAKYSETIPSEMIIYPYELDAGGNTVLISETKLKSLAPNIWNYLKQNQENLEKRMDSRKYYAKNEYWYRFLRQGRFSYIKPEKLIVKGIEKTCCVGFLKNNTAFNGANSPAFIIENDKYSWRFFLALLNSTLISHYLRSICPAKLHGFFRFNANSLNTIPIPETIDDSSIKQLEKLSQESIELSSEIYLLHKKFVDRVLDNFKLEKIPKKIDDIQNLDFKTFLSTMTKISSKKLSLKEQDEWEEYSNDKKNELEKLNFEISRTFEKIDQKVFDLYCISDEDRNTALLNIKN